MAAPIIQRGIRCSVSDSFRCRNWLTSRRGFASASPDPKGYDLYIWGKGDEGQLGIPTEKTAFGAAPVLQPHHLKYFPPGTVRDVSCGQTHTAVVNTAGELFTFGNGAHFKLGHGSIKDATRPTLVKSLAEERVKVHAASCGDFHTAILDRNGRLFTWGWGGNFFSGGGALGHGTSSGDVEKPKLVEHVAGALTGVQVGAGENHTAMLTDDGEVWVCGSGEYGRCGNGSTNDCTMLEPVIGLEDKVVTRISVGHAFTMALTSTGELYGWGRNDGGQLGLGGGLSMDVYAMENLPKQVDALSDEAMIAVSAGHTHTAAVSDDGRLFMWGMKRYLEPEHISALDGINVTDVGCGKDYVAVITDTGDLYTFGKGRTCCLGHGEKKTLPQPQRVEFFAEKGLRVVRVSCGDRHIAVLTEKIGDLEKVGGKD